jgi:hypothetical protein
MTDIIKLPVNFRKPLPPDAFPSGRERHAVVYPDDGAWCVMETDEDGGSIVSGLTKAQAVQHAVEIVLIYHGTMEVTNTPPDNSSPWGCSA